MTTVKKLIEELKKCDPDKEVVVGILPSTGYGDDIDKVMSVASEVDSVEEFDEGVIVWRTIRRK